MNNITLSGRLVYETEVKATKDGKNYLTSRIAVDRHDKDKNTDFFNIKAWGNTAEFIGKYFHKGDPIAVVGELRSESYTKQDGTKAESIYILISKVEFIQRSSRSDESVKAAEPKNVPDAPLPFEI